MPSETLFVERDDQLWTLHVCFLGANEFGSVQFLPLHQKHQFTGCIRSTENLERSQSQLEPGLCHNRCFLGLFGAILGVIVVRTLRNFGVLRVLFYGLVWLGRLGALIRCNRFIVTIVVLFSFRSRFLFFWRIRSLDCKCVYVKFGLNNCALRFIPFHRTTVPRLLVLWVPFGDLLRTLLWAPDSRGCQWVPTSFRCEKIPSTSGSTQPIQIYK